MNCPLSTDIFNVRLNVCGYMPAEFVDNDRQVYRNGMRNISSPPTLLLVSERLLSGSPGHDTGDGSPKYRPLFLDHFDKKEAEQRVSSAVPFVHGDCCRTRCVTGHFG